MCGEVIFIRFHACGVMYGASKRQFPSLKKLNTSVHSSISIRGTMNQLTVYKLSKFPI